MDQVECQENSPVRQGVVLEPLTQSGITLYWAELAECLKQSLGGDLIETASAQHALRAGRLGAWVVWVPAGEEHRVSGTVVTHTMSDGMSGRTAVNIYGIHGNGVTLDQWKGVFGQLCDMSRQAGMSRVIAMTPHANVVKLAEGLGFKVTNLLVKEL